MNDFQLLMRNKKIIFIAVVTTVSLVTLSVIISMTDFNEVDRSDYSIVGQVFIEESGFIANKIGKVVNVDHVGKGGSGGSISYNVYEVRGTNGTGVCNMDISRTSANEWYVTSATLAYDGKTLNVPVKRSVGDKIKQFKLN